MQLIKENIQPLADDLMSYCQKHLGYKSSPSLHFQEDQQNSMNPLGSTAHYSPDENKVVVYVTGRHVKDVLRSLAHELVHHLQNTRGEFDQEHETGPGYAQKDGHMRNMEKEAYLLGNLLFRDWEDQKKLQESKQMKKSKLEEMVRKVLMEKIKNPGKYKTGMKAGYDKDGDGVPNGADKAPEDGSVKETYGNPDRGGQASRRRYSDEREIDREYYSADDRRKEKTKKDNDARYKAALRAQGLLEDEEQLEEGGAANRQGNEDKDQGRERMLPDRLKEEEEVDETYGNPDRGGQASKRRYNPDNEIDRAYYSTADREKEEIKKRNNARLRAAEKAHGLREEDEVEEGTAIARDRLAAKQGQGVKTSELGKKGPAPTATSRLKREYEDKFADIEATSKLHETKQQKLNKRLMEWCTK
jgi:hypothetical protein